jgi:hypothetical protein
MPPLIDEQEYMAALLLEKTWASQSAKYQPIPSVNSISTS